MNVGMNEWMVGWMAECKLQELDMILFIVAINVSNRVRYSYSHFNCDCNWDGDGNYDRNYDRNCSGNWNGNYDGNCNYNNEILYELMIWLDVRWDDFDLKSDHVTETKVIFFSIPEESVVGIFW